MAIAQVISLSAVGGEMFALYASLVTVSHQTPSPHLRPCLLYVTVGSDGGNRGR